VYLKYKYWFFKKAIPVDICQKILVAGRSEIKEVGVTSDKNSYKERKCKVSWLDDKWLYKIINPYIHEANKNAGWNFDWDWNEASQFTIYNKDGYYGWHVDQGFNNIDHKNKNINGKTRKLSLTLQLTDKTEYEGGDFQFKWLVEDEIETITVDDAKDIGTIIIFPSFIHHQVMPITKGKRESLVNWSIGPPFK